MNDRTQIAAMVLAGVWAPLDEGASRVTYAVAQADALLAELAKTAKPEAAPTIEEVTEGRTVTVYPCPRCGETDPEAKLEEQHTGPDWCMHIRRTCHELRVARESQNEAWTRAEAAEARVKELEADVERWQRNYNIKLLEWDKSLMKWRGIIGCGLSTNQPELLIVIDAALEQSVKDAARIKELEAEVQRIRAAPWGVWTKAQLSAEVDRLTAALQAARAEGAREERERIIDVLDKTDYGMVVGWRGFKRDELVRLLEPKP